MYTKQHNDFTISSRDPIYINEKGSIDIGGDNVDSPVQIEIPGYTIHAWSSEWGGITITPTTDAD